MSGLKITSPGMLLIFAITSAGAIFLVDLFFLRPQSLDQQQAALSERALGAQKTVETALQNQRSALQRSCWAWANGRQVKDFLAGRDDAAQIRTVLDQGISATQADVAWICDRSGKIVMQWSRRGDVVALGAPPAAGPAAEDGPVRLVDFGANVGLYVRCDVPGEKAARDSAVAGSFWIGRVLDGPSLSQLGRLIGGQMDFVRSQALPLAQESSVTASQSFWHGEGNKLTVAWLAHDHGGKVLGYYRAVVDDDQVFRQAVGARRTVLIILSLSVGLILLVITGVHMLVAGPVLRLMRRLQQIECGKADSHSLTRDLHGEPLEVARRLESAFDEMDRNSKTDALTGLANRRRFDEMLQTSFQQARRYNRPLTAVVIDIDFFKAVNDAGGHPAGDEMIRRVGAAIMAACRKADLPARFGGDEFAILLPESAASDAVPVAERIRKAVADLVITAANVELRATCSIGIADLHSGEIESPSALLSMADRALYAAKELGRNRYVLSQDLDSIRWPDMAPDRLKVNSLSKKLAGLDTHFKDLFVSAVEEVIETLEQRNPHMADHAHRVRHLAVLVAREMELPDRLIKHLSGAAILHDIGMLAMPDSVLLCNGGLNEQQWQIMQRHPQIGARIMEGMEFLEQEIPTVRYHHEHFDGTGYPEGLVGAQIPLSARILAVADSFEAMTSPRAFRGPRTPQDAVEEIKAKSGSQFDPIVVESFVALAERLSPAVLLNTQRQKHTWRIKEDLQTQLEAQLQSQTTAEQ
ncbi:MAG: diguanylate cyclase [Planctomycetaceae bacterium]|nr:diguanylate cyclase [Planctomycetaceae bacterium]